jgi:hypothetical protein
MSGSRVSQSRAWVLFALGLFCAPSWSCGRQDSGRQVGLGLQGTPASLARLVSAVEQRDYQAYAAASSELIRAYSGGSEAVPIALEDQLRRELREGINWPGISPPTAVVLVGIGGEGIRHLLRAWGERMAAMLRRGVVFLRQEEDSSALARIRPDDEGELIAAFQDEREELQVRYAAIMTLGIVHFQLSPRAVHALAQIVNESKDFPDLWMPAELSMEHAAARSSRGFIDSIASGDDVTRFQALEALVHASATIPPGVEQYRLALLRDPAASIREEAAYAWLCWHREDADVRAALLELLDSDQALDQRRGLTVVSRLEKIPDWAVEGVRRVIAGRTDPKIVDDAVDLLMERHLWRPPR